jgi:TatA/E family protein of Tat protein translocase
MDVTQPLASLSNLFSGDMVIIGAVALLLFGKNLPTVARNVGRTIAEFKRAASMATSEIRREMDEAARAADVRSDLRIDNIMGDGATPANRTPDTTIAKPRVQPSANTVAYTPAPPRPPAPAVSPSAALDTFRIDVKPPTKIPPPV